MSLSRPNSTPLGGTNTRTTHSTRQLRPDRMSVECSVTKTRSESLYFRNAAGETLAGKLVYSPHETDRAVLLCHGYASYKDGFQLPKLAVALAERAGYNSFRWDFSGNGDSQGAFCFANYHGEVEEIRAAKQFLEQHHGQQVVGLLGHSKGGCDVILYAAKYDDIPRVINVAGRFNMKDGVTMRFGDDVFERVQAAPVAAVAQRDDGLGISYKLTKQDLDERVSIDMAAAASSIKRSTVLTIHGTADTVIPVQDGRQFTASIANSSLVEVEGADHNFRAEERCVQELIQAVLQFLTGSRQ